MSGVAGADRIKSRQDFQQFINSYKQLISKFPGFVSIQPSGSYNSNLEKNDFGDIDLITHIKSAKTKKEVKLELVKFFEAQPDTQIVAFTSDKHAGKRSYNSGEIVTVRYHDDVLGYSAQIDNIIALDQIEAGFKQQFLDMPAEKQGLVLGLVKIATVETPPEQLFAKLGINIPAQLGPNQEFEFNLSSSELQLRKVAYKPGTYEQVSRDILWRSQNYDDLQKLLYQYDLSKSFEELLAQSQATIKNPRSKNRMQGVFGSMITVKSGEVGTAKGANKVAALDKIKSTFAESMFNALVESNSGTMVFAFGRFNPPTIGHELLVNTVQKVAGSHKAAYAIYVSRTQDKKKNPLPLDSKLHYLKQMFPGVHFVGASDEVRTFMEAAKSFDGKFKNLIMVAGGDRVPVFEETLLKYNHIEYHFDSIQVVSAGARDPDADDASGASGTKMREYAVNNDLQSFLSQLPRTIDEHTAQQMMNEIRTAMGVKTEPMAESRLQQLIAETKRMSAAVKLQKAFKREQEKSAASRERGNNILNPKKASETPKPVGAGSGKVKMSEGSSDFIINAVEDLRVSKPGLDIETFLDELYFYLDAEYGKRAADMVSNADEGTQREWYANYNDMAEGLDEFAPAGGGGNIPRGPKTPKRDPWGDNGEDPYELRRYNRSIDFFSQFDSDGVDKQKFDKATGEYEGYYFDRDAASGITQIAYFKFDDPKKIGDNDPGVGWYYEPIDEGIAEGRKANTASARAGLAKREKRADPTMDAKKKSEQDAAWERLQAHMNKPENMAVMKRLATKEGTSKAMGQTAKRLTDPNDGKVAKLRAAGDKRREEQLKGRDIAKKNEAVGAMDPAVMDKISKGVKAWNSSNRDVEQLMFQGYMIKFYPNKIEFYKGGDLVSTKEGDFSNLTNQLVTRAKNHVSHLIYKSKNEAMLPKSAFVGSDKNKLGPAGQLKGKDKRPAKAGDLVGAGESYEKKKGNDGKACWKGYKYNGSENGKDKCVPVGETAENILGKLIKILESK